MRKEPAGAARWVIEREVERRRERELRREVEERRPGLVGVYGVPGVRGAGEPGWTCAAQTLIPVRAGAPRQRGGRSFSLLAPRGSEGRGIAGPARFLEGGGWERKA